MTCRARLWPAAILWAVVAVAALAALVAVACTARAQTDPPPLGLGDWTISDSTLIQDRFVTLNGSITVRSGGELELRNSTVLFVLNSAGEHGLVVEPQATLRVLSGSRFGGSRVDLGWTFVAQAGSTVRILDSSIDDCGRFGYGLHHDFTVLSAYMGTSDAVIERSTFVGGFVCLCYPEGVIAPPPRNCTFEGYYGIVTWGTSVEDCTFRDQTYYGVLVMGGNDTVVRRCRFEGLKGVGFEVGLDERDVGPIDIGTGRVEDSTFVRCQVGVRCSLLSHLTVVDCAFDGMNVGAIYPEPGMNDDPADYIANVELVNGRFVNTTNVIVTYWKPLVNWTVTTYAEVVGGNVSLPGNLVLRDGAHLLLKECRDLTQANRAGRPLTVTLGTGAHLEVVNGSLMVPRLKDAPYDWVPMTFVGTAGNLTLVGASTVNVSYPVTLDTLRCERTTLRLGEWNVRRALLHDCVLQRDLASVALLHLVRGGNVDASEMVRCRFDWPSSQSMHWWLQLTASRLTSVDTLHDLMGEISSGNISFDVAEHYAEIEVYWTARASVRWQNQAPAAGADVLVEDSAGSVTHLTTQGDGTTLPVSILTERMLYQSPGASRLPRYLEIATYYPLNLTASFHGLHGEARVMNVSSPIDVVIILKDDVPPVLTLDQGDSLATNRTTLTLTGNATDAHSGVAFMEASVLPRPYVRVPVSPTGAFSVELPLTTGMQAISLRLYDNVGNRAEMVIAVYSTTRPPFINLTEPSQGAWVNTTLVYIVGRTEAGTTVEIRGRTQLATYGDFRILAHLAEGENSLLVNATDLAGNHNQTFLVVKVDTVPPALELDPGIPPTIHTRDPTLAVSGRTEAGARAFVNSVELAVDADGRFSARVSLKQGFQVVTVKAQDRAGNEAELRVVVYLDSVPPPLTVLWPPEGTLRTNSTLLVVRLLTETGVLLTVNNLTLTAAGPSVNVSLPLADGVNAIAITAMDEAGNHVGATRSVDVHRAPPALSLSPPPPARTSEAFLHLDGATEPNASVAINGAVVSVDPDGTFSRGLLLSEGHNLIRVTATDEYGNTASVSYDVEMVPTTTPPHAAPPSLVPILLGLTAMVLAVEALALLIMRSRRKGPGG